MLETLYFPRQLRLQTCGNPQKTAKPCASATQWFSGETVTSEARQMVATHCCDDACTGIGTYYKRAHSQNPAPHQRIVNNF